ncbi:hypothetical protein FRX31_028713 [Thalictrum thalictroides]|uniref:Uncharacterized protein n=1 Tax=Thalictrum thalictroides TaxID=46969 RepID=A0A7J6VBV4_THATH|nr:hypothetical protein FRX31_028713 [Thalictrum thalictroides]
MDAACINPSEQMTNSPRYLRRQSLGQANRNRPATKSKCKGTSGLGEGKSCHLEYEDNLLAKGTVFVDALFGDSILKKLSTVVLLTTLSGDLIVLLLRVVCFG